MGRPSGQSSFRPVGRTMAYGTPVDRRASSPFLFVSRMLKGFSRTMGMSAAPFSRFCLSAGHAGLVTPAELQSTTLGRSSPAAAAAAGGDDVFLFVFLLLVGEGHDGAHDEGLGRLVVHGAERRELRDHLVEEARLQSEGVVGDGRLLREHHGAGRVRVGAEQAPVDEATVTEIRVVGLFRGHREHALHELLRLLRVLQEELHRGGEQLELHAGRLLVEGLEEGLHELIGVVDALGVLADDPDHGGLGLGLVERLEVLAEGGDDLLVAVRVAAEDVLDHDDRLLHDVVDACLDELEKHGDAALRGALELDGAAADGAHGAAHEVHVDLRGVLLELEQHLVDVRLADQADHDLQLLQLDVDGVVVLAEEDLDLVLQDLRALLHDEVDVAQGDVLHFRLAVDERHERRRQLAAQQADGLVVGHRVHVRQDHLDRRHDDGGVRVLEARRDTLDDGLGLAGGLRHILGQRVEDEHLAPLGALVQRGEELLEHRRRNQHHVRLRGLGDLAERGHAVGHHRRVGVADELAELVDEATVLHELRADVVELGHADGGGLAHVGILVAKRPSQGLQQILGDPLHANAAHGANRERADQRVGVRSVLDEGVDRQKRQIRLALGVVDEVEIHQLLELDVVGLDAVHDVREQLGHVLSHGDIRDDLLHRVHLLLPVLGRQLLPQLMRLTLLAGGEKARVGAAFGSHGTAVPRGKEVPAPSRRRAKSPP
mmetsp:Transcript_777/g.3202  ORF Transcript_777/g.3202 Transcript_777/m.3202 type:complete len:716 (+) Transcript_777:454-2601(+)